MEPAKIFWRLSVLVSLVFTTISLLAVPLWADIHAFLGTKFPVMLAAVVFGMVCLAYALLRWWRPAVKRPQADYPALSLAGLVMLALLYVLLSELGSERVILWRNAARFLPPVVFFISAALLLVFPPGNRAFRAAISAVFLITSLVWVSLPWTIRMTSAPIAIINGSGVSLVWGTNMPAVSHIDYGPTDTLGASRGSQSDGLAVISDRIQQVSLPWDLTEDLYFEAASLGVKALFPTSAVTFGPAESGLVQVPFPAQGEDLTWIAFSDLHEQSALVSELSANLDWQGIDYAFYVGDLLNNTDNPNQVVESILELPTGGTNIPRVFVRGNHETRGPAARQLDEWLLPPGGNWYFTFTAGDVFFIILDSGEDKSDDHPEYAGLVDFASYHQQQAEWLSEVFEEDDYQQAQYRVVFVHIPPFTEPTEEFSPVVELLKRQETIALVISGHIHQSGIWHPVDTGLPFPVATCGGSSPADMAAVSVAVGSNGLEVTLIDLDGSVFAQEIFP